MHTKIREAYERVGETRVLFGTDVPFHHPVVEIAKVRVSGLSPEAVERVLEQERPRCSSSATRTRPSRWQRDAAPVRSPPRVARWRRPASCCTRYGEDAAVDLRRHRAAAAAQARVRRLRPPRRHQGDRGARRHPRRQRDAGDRLDGHPPRDRALAARARAPAGAGGDGARGCEHPRSQRRHARGQPLLLRPPLRSGDLPAGSRRRGRVRRRARCRSRSSSSARTRPPSLTGSCCDRCASRSPPRDTGIAHRKLSFHERPAATVACAVRVEGGSVVGARIAVGSVGARPVRATAAAEALVGKPVDGRRPRWQRRRRSPRRPRTPSRTRTARVEYKEQLVRVLVERCVRDALS